MKKVFLVAAALVIANMTQAQIYMGKSCVTHFFSKTSMKDIEASSNTAKPVLDAASGSFQMRIQNTSFKFESSFMQEHFNENYMESEKFPFSTFKGKINEKVDYTKDGENKVTCTGTMDMHGITQQITMPGTLTVKGKEISIVSKFKIKPADYKIKVPSLYVKEIAEEIDVDINTVMEPYKK
ncbi:MAG TPA: YceI family protein [Bacteroidia bacterium]|jgi:polyisoprenoid-binding protein YceI|nr:YceI family protein [Bacteroidia bacterium]